MTFKKWCQYELRKTGVKPVQVQSNRTHEQNVGGDRLPSRKRWRLREEKGILPSGTHKTPKNSTHACNSPDRNSAAPSCQDGQDLLFGCWKTSPPLVPVRGERCRKAKSWMSSFCHTLNQRYNEPDLSAHQPQPNTTKPTLTTPTPATFHPELLHVSSRWPCMSPAHDLTCIQINPTPTLNRTVLSWRWDPCITSFSSPGDTKCSLVF